MAQVKTDKKTLNKSLVALIVLVVIELIGGVIFLFANYYSTAKKTVTQKQDKKQAVTEILTKIGALYDLPTGETPTIATVSDKTKLDKQAFFAKAENGDNVLIYSNAKKAILYRPSINKVMEVAPLVMNVPTAAPQIPNVTPTPTIEKKISVSIYNGTKITGLATAAEKKVTEAYKNSEVVEKGDTIKIIVGK
ncbi:MAG: hypothetical protein NTV98_03650 [Candidatus Roizmanbacteria bacterium]|nr:hypothetical protein [Candidatus Roizmanbacteria bacterium]